MNITAIDIIDGIKNNEFFLEYQPICEINTGKIVGIEALLRWNSLKFRSLINPDFFYFFAIEENLTTVLDAHLIRLVCKEVSAWKSKPAGFFISIKVFPSQILYKNFPEFIARCMAEYAIDPTLLCIEITEHVPFEVTTQIRKAINQIRRLGCKVVLDDFGSGYMSLSKFALLDIDGIKITLVDYYSSAGYSDKCLALVSAVFYITSTSGISLVVEHIETPEQKMMLSEFPGIFGQGYYFGCPTKLFPQV